MILGDPYKFAVMMDEVPQWNPGNYTFRNGVLFYCFNGTLFPEEVQTVPLTSDLNDLLPRMRAVPTDDARFSGDCDDVFRCLYKLRFPPDYTTDEEYRFDLTPLAFSDTNHHVFAVRGNTGVRILANVLTYIKEESTHDLSNLNTLEAVISHQQYEDIIEALESWLHSNC